MPNYSKNKDETLFLATKSIVRKARIYFYVQLGLTVLQWVALISAFSVKFIGGYSKLVIPLALVGLVCGFFSWIVGQRAKPYYSNADRVRKNLASNPVGSGKSNEGTESSKIPLTIGFANFSGTDLDAFVADDAMVLSPLFARSRVVDAHQIPSAEILFIYAHLKDDGTIEGTNGSGIRQIIQITNAAIVVLSSPNSSDSIQKAISLPGPKTANIIFTLDRNGIGFSQFFKDLFEKMRGGKDMLSAWVELAPQSPQDNLRNAPATLLLAEGGKIAFPNEIS